MIRFVLRSIGFLLLAGAFAALVVDGTRSIAGQRLLAFSLGEALGALGPAPYAAMLHAIGRLPGPVLQAALGLLAVPSFLVAGALGLLLLYLGRSRPRGVGFSRRAT